jgi:isopentenyl-diphosphate delta-isomerase
MHEAKRDRREFVVLVDDHDRPLGSAPKLDVHRPPGTLHRAVSVFVVNSAGAILLQRRAMSKYHFPGLWTNACCGHPRAEESVENAGKRRLAEEMGLAAELRPVGSFIYRADDPDSGLAEHELDHVLLANCDADPSPDSTEVDDWRWIDRDDLDDELNRKPQLFTPWFPHVLAAIDQWSLNSG